MQTAMREVVRVVNALPASDGAGVKLNRVVGTPGLPDLDPFLLFDEFGSESASDYIAGFPDHPHRGFETVTYMLAGRMRHRDNHGHSGLLVSGGVQWMTAGRGIIHSEMPEQESGLMRGFQLWVNLPARDKMAPPRYQEFAPAEIPSVTPVPGVTIKVVAGRIGDVAGPVTGIAVDPIYFDLHLDPRVTFALPLTMGHAAFAFVYDGSATVGGATLAKRRLGVLGDGTTVQIASGEDEARLVVIAGRPIGEPVARYGPFVMNTRDEIIQAFQDYEAGRF
ncbi:MAG: pirin family protein [Alphaproteobacteria bacterium]|nr:pirin family protein [Alphaproteobacteria bacterium]